MKMLARILVALLCVTAAHAQDVKSTQPAAGQYPGTTTNDFASAGNVGELLTSTCPTGSATITVTIATPAVVTYTAHGFSNTAPASDVCPIVFTTTGALPTGITSGTTYWTVPSSYATNTFQIATSATNAIAGTSVNTSGTQSGTQTGTRGSGLVTTTAKTILARTLTAGDWDVQCFMSVTAGANTLTIVGGGPSSTDNTFGSFGTTFETDSATQSGGTIAAASPWVPVELSTTTSYFCITLAQFTGSATANGKFVARRRR